MRFRFISSDDVELQLRAQKSGVHEAATEAEREALKAHEYMKESIELIASLQDLLEDSANNILQSIRLKTTPDMEDLARIKRCEKIISDGKANTEQAHKCLAQSLKDPAQPLRDKH
jgi:hypothetical protein